MKNPNPRRAHRGPGPIRRFARGVRRRLAGEAGFTIIEVLVASALALVVVVGPLTFIVVSTTQQNAASSRTVAARQGEVGLEKLVRDLRSAIKQTAVTGARLSVTASATGSTTTIAFSIPTPNANSTAQSVTWSCTAGATCTRKLGAAAAGTEITGVTSVALLDSSGAALTLPATNPTYLGITLNLQATSQLGGGTQAARLDTNPIVVQTGVDLRNFA